MIWQKGLCGQGILRCKCGIVNWRYVRVGVGKLQYDIADGCVLSGGTDM